jgi:hypothetical protein
VKIFLKESIGYSVKESMFILIETTQIKNIIGVKRDLAFAWAFCVPYISQFDDFLFI